MNYLNLRTHEKEMYDPADIFTRRDAVLFPYQYDEDFGFENEMVVIPKEYVYSGIRHDLMNFIGRDDKTVPMKVEVPFNYGIGESFAIREEYEYADAEIIDENGKQKMNIVGVIYPDEKDILYCRYTSTQTRKFEILSINRKWRNFGYDGSYARKFVKCIGVEIKPVTEMTREETAYYRSLVFDGMYKTPYDGYIDKVYGNSANPALIQDVYTAVYKFKKCTREEAYGSE